MPYYEVIYETGRHSVAMYEDDEEATNAIKEHHQRATNGMPAAEGMGPAERIAKVLKYDEHPASFNENQMANPMDVANTVKEKTLGDLVSLPEVASAVRDMGNPTAQRRGPHDSNFKMQEEGELTGWQ